jgi:nucleoside-diphosphate-sugar epimerase
MKRVAITGANGTVGVAIMPALAGFEVTSVGPVPEYDRNDYSRLKQAFDRHDAVIHLGWIKVMGEPEPGSHYLDVLPIDNRHLENLEFASAVIQAARECGVRRLILASSVRADNFQGWRGPGLLSPDRVPTPIGPYGAAKVLLEEQGRFAASLGLEVICVRLGAITASDKPHRTDASERRVWLSHRDCGELIRTCLIAPAIPSGFCVFYAVSNNEGRMHDIGNPLGWRPNDTVLTLSLTHPLRKNRMGTAVRRQR